MPYTPRASTTPVFTPAPALPWWPAAQQAQQDEARLRAQVAALPGAQHARLTQQARQVLTRQGVPAWMQIGPVVEAAMWELQQNSWGVLAPGCHGGTAGQRA